MAEIYSCEPKPKESLDAKGASMYVTLGDSIQQKQLFFPDFREINAVTLLLRFTAVKAGVLA